MLTRCGRCETEYEEYVAPWEKGEVSSICPKCGEKNTIVVSQEVRPVLESDEYVSCLNCCAEMVPRPGTAVHLCEKCSGEEERRDGRIWMIKKVGVGVFGPFNLATIIRWIKAEKISQKDEIAKIGARWNKLISTPEVASLLRKGMGKEVSIEPERQRVVRKPIFIERAEVTAHIKKFLLLLYNIGAFIFTLSIIALISALSYHLIEKRYFVIPEEYLLKTKTLVKDLYLKVRPGNEEVMLEDSSIEKDFYGLVDEIKKREGDLVDIEGASYLEYLLRGRNLYLTDFDENYEEAMKFFEKSFILNPDNPFVISFLMECYSRIIMLKKDVELKKRGMVLLKWADLYFSDVAEVFRAKAFLYISLGRPLDALPLLKKALEIYPDDAETKLGLAISLLELKKGYEEIKSLLVEALKNNPDIMGLYTVLGSLEGREKRFRSAINYLSKHSKGRKIHGESQYLSGIIMNSAGLPEKALEYFDKVPEGNRYYGHALIEKARIEYQVFRNYMEAMRILARVDRLFFEGKGDKESELRFRIHSSIVARLTGNIRDAVFQAEKAKELIGGKELAYFHGGIARIKGGDIDKGIKYLKELMNYDLPARVKSNIYYLIGHAYWKRKKLKDAILEFQSATDEWRFNIPAYLDMISIHAKLDDLQGVLNTIDELRKIDPLYQTRLTVLNDFFCPEEVGGNRLDYMRKLVATRSYRSEAHTALGVILFMEGARRDAVRSFRRAFEENPDNPTTQFFIGLVLYSMGNYTEALSWFRKTIDIEPQIAINYIYAGECLLKIGRLDQAKEMFENSLKYELNLPHIYDGIGLCLALSGDSQSARNYFLKAIEIEPDYKPSLNNLYRYGEEK